MVAIGAWIDCPCCEGLGGLYHETSSEDDVRGCPLCIGRCQLQLPIPMPATNGAREAAVDAGLISDVEDEDNEQEAA
jgi:hypothetical protein